MRIVIKDLNGKWLIDKQGSPMWGAHLVDCPWTLEQLRDYRQIVKSWIDAQGKNYNPGHGGIKEQALAALVSSGLTLDESIAILCQPSMHPEPLSNAAIGAHVLFGCIKIKQSNSKWSKPIKAIEQERQS